MKSIYLATEDALSENVGKRLLAELEIPYHANLIRKGGNGYLRRRLNEFIKISSFAPVLLITDLDTHACPQSLMAQWGVGTPLPKSFLFRVAVREIEAWLLADHVGMKMLLEKGARRLPDNPDSLSDPKQSLLEYAKSAPRSVRGALIAERGAIASQGLGYNAQLSEFVISTWDPTRAAARSDSLNRARKRIKELASG